MRALATTSSSSFLASAATSSRHGTARTASTSTQDHAPRLADNQRQSGARIDRTLTSQQPWKPRRSNENADTRKGPAHRRNSNRNAPSTASQEANERPQGFTGKERSSVYSRRGDADFPNQNKDTFKFGSKASSSKTGAAREHKTALASKLKHIRTDSLSTPSEVKPPKGADAKPSSRTSEAQRPREDPLSTVQIQLKAFFNRSESKSTSIPDEATHETVTDHTESDPFLEPVSGDMIAEHYQTTSAEDGATSTSAENSPEVTRKFSRPTLSDLQKADPEQFVGLYQSDTAWDPSRDYVLFPDGPRRKSFLEMAFEERSRQYIVVILDADNLMFDPRHLRKGYDGGKFVCQELRQRIAGKHQLVPHLLDLRIRVFCALNPLATVLNNSRVVSKSLFFDFLQAIGDSGLHNYVVNVGRGDQAADMRVKAALADALRDPGCYRAYLGGLDDFGYKDELRAIKEMDLLESKVNLIQVPGYAVDSNAYREYAHRALDLDYLFKNNEAAMKEMQDYVSAEKGFFSTLPRVSSAVVFFFLSGLARYIR